MLSKLKSLFNGPDRADSAEGPEDMQVAVAALLIEAAAADENVDTSEYDAIARILARHFKIDDSAARSLMESATVDQEKSDHILHFTRSIKENFELEDRVEIMEMLWEVSYADGVIDHYESNLIRRVAGLIYVTDKDSGLARQKVLKKLKLDI